MGILTLHLDTNLLIDLITARSPHIAVIRGWLADGEKLGASSIAWSEFCNGPLTIDQKDAVFAIVEHRVSEFTWQQAEDASRLFHRTGRRRGSHADCMIAAAAIGAGVPVATRNVKDFDRFVPFGLKLRAVATIPSA
ncbi:MAG: PIN domain-containing protein [Chthoniobacteraceae bacterium]